MSLSESDSETVLASISKNPCVGCGACCAHFRVQFYWREANPEDKVHAVPAGMHEDLTSMHRCMRGTATKHHPKCVGLKGKIGETAQCSIYLERPTPCDAFQASYVDGNKNPRCDDARRAHGLRPLRPDDWK